MKGSDEQQLPGEDFASRHFASFAVLVASAGALIVALTARTSWFFADDNRNLWEARDWGLGARLLGAPIIGERLAPGHRLLDWLVVQFPGESWLIAAAIGVASAFASALLLAYTARRISGSAVIGLSCALLFGLWAGWPRATLWWAASAHLLPSTFFSIASAYFAIRWDESRKALAATASVIAIVLAFSFSMRAMVVPLVLIVLLVIARPPEGPLTVRGTIRRGLVAIPLVVPALAAAAVYTAVGLRTDGGGVSNPAALGQYLSYGASWMTAGLGAVSSNSLPRPGDYTYPGMWLGFLILALFALATIRTRRSAAVWVGIVLLIAFCGLQVGHRLNQVLTTFGSYGALVDELRYHEGDVLVLALLVPAAWRAAGSPAPTTRSARRLLTLAGALFLATWVASGVVSRSEILSKNQGKLARATSQTLSSSLERLPQGQRANLNLVDTRLPLGLTTGTVRNERGLDRLLEIFHPDPPIATMAGPGLPLVVDADGRARLLKTRSERIPSAARPRCVRARPGSVLAGPGSAGIDIPVPKPLTNKRYVLMSLRFVRTIGDGRAGIVFRPGENNLPDLEVDLGRRGTNHLRTILPPGTQVVSLAIWGGVATCLVADATEMGPG